MTNNDKYKIIIAILLLVTIILYAGIYSYWQNEIIEPARQAIRQEATARYIEAIGR